MEWLLAAIYLFQTSPELQTAGKVADVVGGLGPTGLLGVALYFLAKEIRRLQQELKTTNEALDNLQQKRVEEAQASADVMLAFLRRANPSGTNETRTG